MDEGRIDPIDRNLGISRRTLLRRGAIVGGTLVWAAPVVQSIAPRAFAQNGTPACEFSVELIVNGDCVAQDYADDTDCCDCLEERAAQGPILALLTCINTRRCDPTPVGDLHAC